MKRVFFLGMSALLAAGCVRTEIRYEPPIPTRADSLERLTPISGLQFKDSSRGVHYEGTALILKRPFYDTFRQAVAAQFAALKVPMTPGAAGPTVEVELTRVDLKRGRGFIAHLTSTVSFIFRINRGGETACRQEVSGWSNLAEGVASSPAPEVLQRALAQAMEKIGPAIASSCLDTTARSPSVAYEPRDLKAWALVVGIERYRGSQTPSASAASEARAAAEYARSSLGVPGDQVVEISDDMATLADLHRYFERWLPDHVAPDGKVFVAFFGRVARDSALGGAYLVPYDGDSSFLEGTAFPLARLYADLERLVARATVVLGADVPAGEILRLPANVRVIAADKNPRAAFDEAKASWNE